MKKHFLNMMSRPLAWMSLFILFCNAVRAAAPDWRNQIVSYPNYTGVLARVKLNGATVSSEGSLLAAFHGDETTPRGVAEVLGSNPDDDIDGESYFSLLFGSEEAGEKGFTFKLWNSADDRIYDLDKTLDFDTNYPAKPAIYGGFTSAGFVPCVMNVASGKYRVTVAGGTADKAEAEPGEVVTITATLPSNQGLKIWTPDKEVEFVGSVLAPTTTFVMPASHVTIAASFIAKSSMPAVAVRSTTNAGDDTATEPSSSTASATDKGTFTFTRTITTGALTVYFDIRGTAVNGVDYKSIPSSVTFASGKSSVEVVVDPLYDGVTEGDETVEVVLTPAPGIQTYRGGAVTDATVAVKDSAPVVNPTVKYTLSPSAAVTAGARWRIDSGVWNASDATVTTTVGTHTVSFKDVAGYTTPASQTITLKSGDKKTGTAAYTEFDGKYTLTVSGGKINGTATSAKFSPGEEVSITATLPTNQGLKKWTANKDVEFIGSVLGATTTIRMPAYDVTVTAGFIAKSDMPAVAVRSTTNEGDDTAKEPSSSTASATDKGKFTFTRTNVNVAKALTVYYSIRGTAANGADYKSIPSSVTFKANATSVAVEIEPLYDGASEGDETVEVVLEPESGTQTYRGGSVTEATVTIKDTQPPVLYNVTVVNGTASPATAAAGATVTVTANAPAAGKAFDRWTSTSGVTFASPTASTTTFTMPSKAVTVTATYKEAASDPYHPADSIDQDYVIAGLEYLNYAGPVKAAALGNYEYDWDGTDVLSLTRRATRGGGAPATRGGDVSITRIVSPASFTAGSTVEVTLTVSGGSQMTNLFIGEVIPEGWTVLGGAAGSVVDGVLRMTWDSPNIPAAYTYTVQAPAANLPASCVIASNAADTGCFTDGAMTGIQVEDTELLNNTNYHPADCITKDGRISGLEYLKYVGPVKAAALGNYEYAWDGVDVLSIRPKNATRGGAAADDVAISRHVDTTTYAANSQVAVTLTVSGANGMVALFVGERIPEGWTVVGDYAGGVRNGVLRMTWDAPDIPSTVTYTLQAPAEDLSAACKIASSAADTGCFTDRVVFLNAGDTVLTSGGRPAEWPQDLTLYAPADGRNFREADDLAVSFSWPAVLNAEGYRLVVAACDGTVVFDETLEETSCAVRGLGQGAYVWNVTAVGDGCIAGTSDDFRFAVVPAVPAPVIVGAVADGTAVRLVFDTAEAGYEDGEITYQAVFFSLADYAWTSLTRTVTVADGKAVIDLGVAASNGYLAIRPVTTPESDFTELYIK